MARTLTAELHEDPRRGVLAARLVARDLDESGAAPGADGTVVPGVGVDGHARAAALADQMPGHRAGGVRPETSAPRGGREEHVEAVRMDLEIADRITVLLDDPRLDVDALESLPHLGVRERLAVPVARDVGIGMPGDQPVDVVRARRSERRQSSAYEKSHW